MKVQGVWLPIVTPFINDEVDYESYQKLIEYYLQKGIHGLIPLGTTGESPTVGEAEFEQIIDRTVAIVNKRVPVFAGVGGNCTHKTVQLVNKIEKYNIDGILSVCPYYNRPDQNGIYQHFLKIAESTDLSILIYNIPYRTGRNIENDTMHRLAGIQNIIGVKDSCGDFKQAIELLQHRPADFSILTGEDILFYSTLGLGGDGGILASAHLETGKFVSIFNLMQENNYQRALEIWREIADLIPLLFVEPNPAPLKYCLWNQGLIQSPETRLPITGISEGLKARLNGVIMVEND